MDRVGTILTPMIENLGGELKKVNIIEDFRETNNNLTYHLVVALIEEEEKEYYLLQEWYLDKYSKPQPNRGKSIQVDKGKVKELIGILKDK